MNAEFHTEEESLKTFLVGVVSDDKNSSIINIHKYNNLKIYTDTKRFTNPHLIIRIGISEAVYDLQSGDRISGGLGSDERYVRNWMSRYLLMVDVNTIWKNTKKIKQINPNDAD